MATLGNPRDKLDQEEWFVIGMLVQELRRADTWQRIVDLGDAMFHVRLIARGLRKERQMFAESGCHTQSERPPSGGEERKP